METNRESNLRGFVTERDFDLAEREFPGIVRFYADCIRKPVTFLDLLWLYLDGSLT